MSGEAAQQQLSVGEREKERERERKICGFICSSRPVWTGKQGEGRSEQQNEAEAQSEQLMDSKQQRRKRAKTSAIH
jgi:hypothetical protein